MSSTASSQTATIKTLEWAEPSRASNGCYSAKTFFGDYYAAEQDGRWYAGHEDVSFEWLCDYAANSLDDAKAAAQADFESRILACLVQQSEA